jgi:hypothetical protein
MHLKLKHIVLASLTLLVLISLACQLPEATLPATLQPAVSAAASTATNMTAALGASALQPTGATTRTPHPTSAPKVTTQRIGIHRIYGLAEFYDRTDSSSFIPRGVSYAMLVPVLDHYEDRLFAEGIYDHNRVQSDFAALAAYGYNTVRVIIDGCSSGDSCIGIEDGQGLNPVYLDHIADLLAVAKANHLFVLLASQGLPDLGGYAALADQGASVSFAPGRNAQLLTKQGIQASQQYWADLLSGLATRQASLDAILGWELLAEQYYPSDQPPFSLESGRVTLANQKSYDLSRPAQREAMAVDGLRYYIEQVKTTLLTYAPSTLVSMGFLAPDEPNVWREGDPRYVVTAPLLDDAGLDFVDLHASPGNGLSMSEVGENFGLKGHATVPVIMGEAGASTWSYPQVSQAAIAVQDWMAASCGEGFSGWLYTAYYPSPAGLADATWGMVDVQETLLKALAPKTQPDACTVTALPGRDLALGKGVLVSASLPDQNADMAVDGDPNTQWSAGEFPTQWIEIDLGAAYSLGEVRLTVGQWPDGQTVHQLWVGASQGSLQMVHEFAGYTYDYNVLSYAPPKALKNVRYVRLVTTESPSWVSWREIELLAPYPATPTPTIEATAAP